jgi:thioredoxin:protein disulfide reductase
MKTWFMILWLTGLSLLSSITFAISPPPAQNVFQTSVRLIDPNSFFITWQVKPGFFLYADRIKLSAEPNTHVTIGTLHFPLSLTKTDPLGHHYPVYRHELILPVPVLSQQPGHSFLSMTFQGCADDGFCYPPQTQRIRLSTDDHLALSNVQFVKDSTSMPERHAANQNNNIALVFSAHYWPVTLLIFFGLGLLLSFTPCVLPMIPVLSGIIVGHDKISTQKAFGLSLSYVLSMAFTYALIGVTVALLGENLQITMQSPVMITLFSGVFVTLSLSMFGLFDLKLPVSWQAKLAQVTRQQSSGHYLSAAIMGCLSTLVLSPCVTAPLVGALGYIAQTGNLILGGSALFVMGLGMGSPLLLIGTSAGKWLPKAGVWMNAVKSFFGMLLLAVAIYLLTRILPATLIMGRFTDFYRSLLRRTPSWTNPS